jgi:D-alanyl-D-alanine carboxypeptidase
MKKGRVRARRLGVVAGLVAFALVLAGCSELPQATPDWPNQVSGPLPSSITKQLNDAVSQAMTLSGASGAIVGVWAPWSGSWTAGVGTTAVKGATPMTTSMHFRIGQVTTSMTCSVLLQMVDSGKVKLDDKVESLLPQMTGTSGTTLRQLCQNTSGIGDYTAELQPQFVDNPTRQWVPLELVTDGMGAATPGSTTSFTQSNAGIILLGMALQSESGQNWEQLYDRYIFQRLGMDNSSLPTVNSLTAPAPQGYATALNTDGSPQCGTVNDVATQSPTLSWTAGGVVSNLSDLKEYSEALASGALLSKGTAKAQWSTVPMGSPVPSWQTWGLGAQQFGPLRGQVGDVPGFLTAMMSDPTSGLTVVVMLNNSSAGSSFIQNLGLKLATIASTAPAKAGKAGKAPSISLPWTADQTDAAMKAAAVCQPAH